MLTTEQEESTPRTSSRWKPTTTFAADISAGGKLGGATVEEMEKRNSAA